MTGEVGAERTVRKAADGRGPARTHRAVVPVVAALLVVPLAGCADEAPPVVTVRATASDGFLMAPLNYGGTTTTVAGDALVDVDGAANTGTVRATATAGNDTYEITWDRFAAAADRPFQDGGIATQFREHGGSGVGDASIPEVNLIAAGWGPARLTLNGQPYPDPVTGAAEWAAHFMITDTGVFGADRSVRLAGGGVYDPARAAEGATEPGDLELHVVLRNNPGPRQELPPVEAEGAAQGQVATDMTLTVPVVASLNATLFVRPSQAPAPPVSILNLVLRDPSGAEVGTFTSQPGQPGEATFVVDDPVPGEWVLSTTGQGAATAYGATLTLTAPTEAQLYFVYETVDVQTG